MSLALASNIAVSGFFTPAPVNPKSAFKDARFPGPGEPSEVRPGAFTGLPGDVGFDPHGLANFDLTIASATEKTRSAALVLQDYRDAELKHGRLAMLAAVAFPLQEKFNPLISAALRWPNLLVETGGKSPSILNGGLEQARSRARSSPSSSSSRSSRRRACIKKSDGDDWLPGDYGTLRIAEKGTEQFYSLQEGEIWNGRIAMIAIAAYVAQEAIRALVSATIPFW